MASWNKDSIFHPPWQSVCPCLHSVQWIQGNVLGVASGLCSSREGPAFLHPAGRKDGIMTGARDQRGPWEGPSGVVWYHDDWDLSNQHWASQQYTSLEKRDIDYLFCLSLFILLLNFFLSNITFFLTFSIFLLSLNYSKFLDQFRVCLFLHYWHFWLDNSLLWRLSLAW